MRKDKHPSPKSGSQLVRFHSHNPERLSEINAALCGKDGRSEGGGGEGGGGKQQGDDRELLQLTGGSRNCTLPSSIPK